MKSLDVYLDGVVVGHLDSLANNRLSFAYDEHYRHRADATPLSVSMPLSAREHPDARITPFLWNLLPENDAVLARWGQQFHVSPRNVFALMSNIDDLPGGVQLTSTDRRSADESPAVDWIGEDGVQKRLATVRRDHAAWRGSPSTGRWSLPGAQAKIALLLDDGRWGVPSGRIPTNRILKPAVSGLEDHDLNEHLCLTAMRALGLVVADSEIVNFGAERAIVLTRYDRYKDSAGTWRRAHQEDMCQALSVRPEGKYESDGGPGVPAIARLLREVLPTTSAERAMAEFIAAVAFNWVIAGTDAHAKNYGLLLTGRNVRLAPFYDVASLLPYDAYLPKERLAMRISTEYRMDYVRREHWERLAADCRLDAENVLTLVRSIVAAAPAAFEAAAVDPVITQLGSDLPGRLVELVAKRSKVYGRKL